MQERDDYYSILQVHFQAEPEVIESAYKRLARKYHPDVNPEKDSEVRMKRINEAYEILKDTGKRRQYDADRLRRLERAAHQTAPPQQAAASSRTHRKEPYGGFDEKAALPAKEVLSRYFSLIRGRYFEEAYKLITSEDKSKIAPMDFTKWQSSVSRIFLLQDYECKISRMEPEIGRNTPQPGQVMEFLVVTVEHNTVMNRLEKDIISKKVVLEKEGWRIFIGYDDIRPHISRFEELNELLKAKSVINEMVELYSNMDSPTGLYSKKGFIEASEKEIRRYERYGNPLTLMMIEINGELGTGRDGRPEWDNIVAEWAGATLKNCLRKLDLAGRWENTRFIVLLAETGLNGGVKAASKIMRTFSGKRLYDNGKVQKTTLNIGVEEFRGSLGTTIDMLNRYLQEAGRREGSHIVCDSGTRTAGGPAIFRF